MIENKLKKDNLNRSISLPPLLVSLFLVSVSMFVFQVVLTRVFSPMLRYHYVFMVTSMAIFGLGIGGMIVYRLSRKNTQEQLISRLPGWLLLLSASYIGVFSLIFKLPFMNLFVFYSLLAAIPYIVGGIFISTIFKIMPEDSHRLYFADLFGAGIGSLGVVIFMNQLGVANTILLVSGFALISALVLAWRLKNSNLRLASIVFMAVLVLVGSYQPGVEQFESRFRGYFTSPMTSLARIRMTNLEHKLEDWSWDAYSRTDVIDTSNDNKSKVVTIDGGANSQMLRFDGDLSKMEYLREDLNYLPFDMGKNEKVLLIGPGGGKDIVLALLAGSKDIDAVEISGGSVDMVKRYAQYNGDIYGRDEVDTFIQDGRNFVKQSGEQYDIIYLAQVMTGVAETTGYALAENFIYTKEAIRDYWSVLDDDGRISFILHDANDLRKMTLTMVEALEEAGVDRSQIASHIAVVSQNSREGHADNILMPLVVVKKSPFTIPETEQLQEIIDRRMHSPLHLPYIREDSILKGFSDGNLSTSDYYFQENMNFMPT
ncbi:MAG: spermine synthase, partial [Actinomycetota bacterium]